MGLIHTPRTLASIAKGLWRRHQLLGGASTTVTQPSSKGSQTPIGFGLGNAYRYKSRVGLFDVDYLGHMNNAAYLSHAEFARWEMMSCNGLLSHFFKSKMHFIVASTAVRYRQEIRPLFGSFVVESFVAAMDERSVWIFQNFVTPKDGRLRTQVIVQGVLVAASGPKKGVTKPADVFTESMGVDKDVVASLCVPLSSENDTDQDVFHNINEVIGNYSKLETSVRELASRTEE